MATIWSNDGIQRNIAQTLGKFTVLSFAFVIGLTGCQRNTDAPNDATDPATTPTATPTTTDTASNPMAMGAVPIGESHQLPASAVPILPAPQASAPAKVSIHPDTTATTPPPTLNTATSNPVASTPTQAAPPSKQALLRDDLTKLFRTIDEFDRQTQAKQNEIAQKIQTVNTPQEQANLFKQVVSQMHQQKKTLEKLQFNDPRVTQVRNLMIESVNHSIAGTQAMIKNPTATPETHPQIVQHMEKSQDIAVQARERLLKLTQEAEGDSAPKNNPSKAK